VAHRLLRNEGAFAALRVRKLSVSTHDEAGVLALAADLPVHTCLKNVHLDHAPLGTLAVLDAVVDAALALQLASLTLLQCDVRPASANSTLTSLKLPGCRFLQDAAAATSVLDALTAHCSLCTLDLRFNAILAGDQVFALGAAFGALVAANARALHELDLSYAGLDDAALGTLLDALPLNTHLRTLNLDRIHCTNDFARDRLLPAVRANTSLRHLIVSAYDGHQNEFMHEAQALVAARNAAAAP
jgi:hypothetical protein